MRISSQMTAALLRQADIESYINLGAPNDEAANNYFKESPGSKSLNLKLPYSPFNK